MGLLAAAFLLLGVFAYVFWPKGESSMQPARTRIDFLEERREAVMNNLRDLTFEYRAGKYPDLDFASQRDIMEREAAEILREMDALSEVAPRT